MRANGAKIVRSKDVQCNAEESPYFMHRPERFA